MPTRTVDPLLPNRFAWAVLASLAVLSIVAGIWPLTGVLVTWVPLLAVPAAAGLPHLIPPLALAPLGETSWAFWAADVAGAVLMLLTAYVLLRAAEGRRPLAEYRRPRGRALGRAVGVTVLAVAAGNLLRTVFASFVVESDFGTFLGTTLAAIAVSALIGAILGLVVGLIGALASPSRGGRPHPEPA